jgi:transposase
MQTVENYRNERLDHLGIVAGVCQELGLAAWLDALEPQQRRVVSYGTATEAMILNGLGFSNRQLYLVPQFFENKPVEHLLGKGITADMLNDDCLGRTLDWLYAHDPTTLFAGLAQQARQRFGISATRLHVDTTSFSVSGEYPDVNESLIAVTYGYSRDHREDLKQWMLALATTHHGDIPLFMQPLSGNSSDKVSLLQAIEQLNEQLQRDGEPQERIFVADSGLYSEVNMTSLNHSNILWGSRVPETSQEAKRIVQQEVTNWQLFDDGTTSFVAYEMNLPQGKERWLLVRTADGLKRAQSTLRKQVEKHLQSWEKKLWHVSTQTFESQQDAQDAWQRALKGKPVWLQVSRELVSQAVHVGRGRPAKGQEPTKLRWQIHSQVSTDEAQIQRQADQKARFIVASNVIDEQILSHEELIHLYTEQGSVERGFRFLKDPLFLASSVFVKKKERLVALSMIMVLCLLIYRLAEHRLREALAQSGQTIPNQVNKPTARPTMRWVFQCFEGIELLHIQSGSNTQSLVLRLQVVHQHILALLGSHYQQFYFFSQ